MLAILVHHNINFFTQKWSVFTGKRQINDSTWWKIIKFWHYPFDIHHSTTYYKR